MRGVLFLLFATQLLVGQAPDWRRVGNAAMDLGLPSLASGPVARVWFSEDGGTLYAGLRDGSIWETTEFDRWTASTTAALIPAKGPQAATPGTSPENGARVERSTGRRYYAMGRFVYRSDDGGQNWNNLTGYRGESILGDGLTDVAVSPRDEDQVVVASQSGVWRSMDGGATWAGLPDGLENLPARRIVTVPSGLVPARITAFFDDSTVRDLEWAPGERQAWRDTGSALPEEIRLRQQWGIRLGMVVTAVAQSERFVYAGTQDGRIFASPDQGQTWRPYNAPIEAGSVMAIVADGPRAIAALAQRSPEYRAPRVIRTVDGGAQWDDMTSNLPPGTAFGVTADWQTGDVYVGMSAGVFAIAADLANLTLPGQWEKIEGLADARAFDVRLDAAGNQLFVLLEGRGLYGALAPRQQQELKVVNAADFSNRAAAPGSLLSILGGRVDRVRSGNLQVPVLGATDAETQIQVPFEVEAGNLLSLRLESNGTTRTVGVPLETVSPAIFVDRDGAALLLDGESGTALDAMNPARSGSRIQILATGLGAVEPTWPTAIAAPAENPPVVTAPLRVLVDREEVPVLRATLAPGYVGFYVVEVQLPKLINAGPAELYLEAAGQQSNRVRVYLAP
jgi:uncharacterized protein (TIGR03437 family)